MSGESGYRATKPVRYFRIRQQLLSLRAVHKVAEVSTPTASVSWDDDSSLSYHVRATAALRMRDKWEVLERPGVRKQLARVAIRPPAVNPMRTAHRSSSSSSSSPAAPSPPVVTPSTLPSAPPLPLHAVEDVEVEEREREKEEKEEESDSDGGGPPPPPPRKPLTLSSLDAPLTLSSLDHGGKGRRAGRGKDPLAESLLANEASSPASASAPSPSAPRFEDLPPDVATEEREWRAGDAPNIGIVAATIRQRDVFQMRPLWDVTDRDGKPLCVIAQRWLPIHLRSFGVSWGAEDKGDSSDLLVNGKFLDLNYAIKDRDSLVERAVVKRKFFALRDSFVLAIDSSLDPLPYICMVIGISEAAATALETGVSGAVALARLINMHHEMTGSDLLAHNAISTAFGSGVPTDSECECCGLDCCCCNDCEQCCDECCMPSWSSSNHSHSSGAVTAGCCVECDCDCDCDCD